jgi:hypothetical protein
MARTQKYLKAKAPNDASKQGKQTLAFELQVSELQNW